METVLENFIINVHTGRGKEIKEADFVLDMTIMMMEIVKLT